MSPLEESTRWTNPKAEAQLGEFLVNCLHRLHLALVCLAIEKKCITKL